MSENMGRRGPTADGAVPPSHPSPLTHAQPKALERHQAHAARRYRSRVEGFLCRLDVCGTLFFFIFLVCVGVLTTSITQTTITKALIGDLHNYHYSNVVIKLKRLNQLGDRVYSMAFALLSLHSHGPFVMRSEVTLSRICSILDQYDRHREFPFLGASSMDLRDVVACMHGDSVLGRGLLYGWVTENSIIPGTFLVENDTYKFKQPLQMVYGGLPGAGANISNDLAQMYATNKIFREAEAYYHGVTDSIDVRDIWSVRAGALHLLSCTIPVGLVLRGLPLPPGIGLNDSVQIRIDGTRLTVSGDSAFTPDITMAVFINATLADSDPWVMSNSWGQPSVNDSEVLSPSASAALDYLKVSTISDPLMRAALKHVTLRKLQNRGHNETVDFQFQGAPAIVTAMNVLTKHGLVLPMVFVTSHAHLTFPYRRIMDICNVVTAAAILLFTTLFWFFIHRYLHQPLHWMAHRMLLHARTGRRTLPRKSRSRLFQLSEVQQLMQAHRATTERLHQIDAFIPKEGRQQMLLSCRSVAIVSASNQTSLPNSSQLPAFKASGTLMKQFSTVVYITLRPCDVVPAPLLTTATPQQQQSQRPYAGQRLAAVVAHAARAAELVNSGPFPTPAALEAFVAALHRCCDDCDGTVLRLTPDSCVLHFGRAARTHLTATSTTTAAAGGAAGGDADTDACAARDARSALRFAFALLRWVDRCDAARMPDVRVLVDTGVFTCGQYRPRGSEQTMFVALGRDVQRKLGHVPAAIGVRVAMTEETARCVRAGAGTGADAACGVRQLPAAAFRIGRVNLNDDVIILFEALEGTVEGDVAWGEYTGCCFNGFGYMVHGDYAGALRALKNVADISDLEPGLMPKSLRREAAPSSVTGGATSTQVERLMKECVQRVAFSDTKPFLHQRHVPLGIDAVLGAVTPKGVVPESLAERRITNPLAGPHLHSVTRDLGLDDNAAVSPLPHRLDRRVVAIQIGSRTIRSVLSGPPEWVEDNIGLRWHVARRPVADTPTALWRTRLPCLGVAGSLASVTFLAYRHVPPAVREAIRDAPLGQMSNTLRSTVPEVHGSPEQREVARVMFQQASVMQHPNLLMPLAYSTSGEGGLVLVWQFVPGGTLREVVRRYHGIKTTTLARFTANILSGLAFLHTLGVVHGALYLDNVMVGADGVCRLVGQSSDRPGVQRTFIKPWTCYVSPAMARGEKATPACDIFCFGLLCIDLVDRGSVWRWADKRLEEQEGEGEEGREGKGTPERSDEALAALVAEAGVDFRRAVASGDLVPNLDNLEAKAEQDAYLQSCLSLLQRCLSVSPQDRPTAAEVLMIKQNKLKKFNTSKERLDGLA